MEDQIQLTDVLKAFVQSLDKDLSKLKNNQQARWELDAYLDEVKNSQLRLWAVDTEHKVESGVVTVYQLVVRPPYKTAALEEVTDVVVPLADQLEGLLDDLLLLWFILQTVSSVFVN